MKSYTKAKARDEWHRDALNSGISMIHQEINPLLDMTVSANIFLGREPLNKTGLVNERKLAEDTKNYLNH